MDRLLIERVLIGGNHLASSLLSQCDPLLFHSYDDALDARGSTYADMWVAWKAIMDLAEAQRNKDSDTP